MTKTIITTCIALLLTVMVNAQTANKKDLIRSIRNLNAQLDTAVKVDEVELKKLELNVLADSVNRLKALVQERREIRKKTPNKREQEVRSELFPNALEQPTEGKKPNITDGKPITVERFVEFIKNAQKDTSSIQVQAFLFSLRAMGVPFPEHPENFKIRRILPGGREYCAVIRRDGAFKTEFVYLPDTARINVLTDGTTYFTLGLHPIRKSEERMAFEKELTGSISKALKSDVLNSAKAGDVELQKQITAVQGELTAHGHKLSALSDIVSDDSTSIEELVSENSARDKRMDSIEQKLLALQNDGPVASLKKDVTYIKFALAALFIWLIFSAFRARKTDREIGNLTTPQPGVIASGKSVLAKLKNLDDLFLTHWKKVGIGALMVLLFVGGYLLYARFDTPRHWPFDPTKGEKAKTEQIEKTGKTKQ